MTETLSMIPKWKWVWNCFFTCVKNIRFRFQWLFHIPEPAGIMHRTSRCRPWQQWPLQDRVKHKSTETTFPVSKLKVGHEPVLLTRMSQTSEIKEPRVTSQSQVWVFFDSLKYLETFSFGWCSYHNGWHFTAKHRTEQTVSGLSLSSVCRHQVNKFIRNKRFPFSVKATLREVV